MFLLIRCGRPPDLPMLAGVSCEDTCGKNGAAQSTCAKKDNSCCHYISRGRIASSESDPMVALTSETRRSMLNALPRKLAGVMFYRLFHLQGCPPSGGHGNGSQPSRSWLEPLKSPGMQSRKQGQYASGPCKTGLGEGRLQEVPHPQHVGPVTQIGQIKRGSLPAYDAQDVIPLACRGTSAHLKPLELREDRILRRCDAHRARARL